MSSTGDDNLRQAFRALAGGSVEALEVIWRDLARPLHHYAFALTASQEAADDILSEVLARLPGRGLRLRFVRNPRGYLYAAVRNAALTGARRRKYEAERAVDEASPPAGDLAEALAIREAILALPAEQREVVVLHIWGGLSFREIGATTGVPQDTAASRYRYALSKLRATLGDQNDDG